jgi:hypothetical protein
MRLVCFSVLMFTLGSMVIATNLEPVSANNMTKIKETGLIRQNVDETSRIELHNKVGNIRLKPGESNLLKGVIEKIVQNGTKELAAELFDAVKIKILKHGNMILFEIFGWENIDQIKQKYRNVIDIGKVGFAIDYDLEVPANLTQIDINTGVGDITISDLTGSFALKTGVGDIVLKDNLNIIEKSNLFADVGNIDARITTIEPAAEMNIKVKNGNIDLSLFKNIQSTMEIDEFMEARQTRLINGGGVKINVQAELGKVQVTSFE